MNAVLESILSRPVWELTGIAALVMLLLGVWMSWRRHSALEGIEEDVKNIKLTPEQAWRRTRWVNHAPPVVITVGVILMIVAVAVFAWH